jgi:hypothetical protein
MAILDLELFARSLLGRAGARRPSEAEFVDTRPVPGLHGKEELIWNESSFDLRSGLDMTEQPMDTLPGELRAMFGRK